MSLDGKRTACCTSAVRVILCQYNVCFSRWSSATLATSCLSHCRTYVLTVASWCCRLNATHCDSTMVRRAHALVLAAVLLAAGSAHAQSQLHVRQFALSCSSLSFDAPACSATLHRLPTCRTPATAAGPYCSDITAGALPSRRTTLRTTRRCRPAPSPPAST